MDKIIDRLSDIEKAAGSLMDDAGVRKKALAKEMEEKTAAFDRELEQKNSCAHFMHPEADGAGDAGGTG